MPKIYYYVNKNRGILLYFNILHLPVWKSWRARCRFGFPCRGNSSLRARFFHRKARFFCLGKKTLDDFHQQSVVRKNVPVKTLIPDRKGVRWMQETAGIVADNRSLSFDGEFFKLAGRIERVAIDA